MNFRDPYKVIKHLRVTEKSQVLKELADRESNASLRRCKVSKYVFNVQESATKIEIAHAVEAIYADQRIKVKSVNTIRVKPKRRRIRGRVGYRPGFKKAIVTLESGDRIEEES